MLQNHPLIFLDVDGVLNTHEPLCPHVMCGQIHQEKVALLKRVLLQTQSRVVLSSAWRYLVHRGEMNLTGLNWLFRSHGFPADSIVGITREDTMFCAESQLWPVANERGIQISEWRTEHNHQGPYVVVDDLDLGITAAGHPFVHTFPHVGLTAELADLICQTLEHAGIIQ